MDLNANEDAVKITRLAVVSASTIFSIALMVQGLTKGDKGQVIACLVSLLWCTMYWISELKIDMMYNQMVETDGMLLKILSRKTGGCDGCVYKEEEQEQV